MNKSLFWRRWGLGCDGVRPYGRKMLISEVMMERK